MIHRFSGILLFLALSFSLHGQDVSFETNVNTTNLFVGGQLSVQFVLNNARGTSFKAPDFDGFRVLRGPSVSNEIQIINGRQSSRQVYSYLLQPQKAGNYTFDGASIQAGGKTMRSNAVTVVVEEAPTTSLDPDLLKQKSLFVVAQMSKDTVYPGEAVQLDIMLYSRVELGSFEFTKLHDFSGIFVQNIGLIDRSVYAVNIDGVRYNSRLLRRIMLYPQTSGTYDMGTCNVQVEVALKNQRRSWITFPRLKTEFLTSNPLSLEVLPLPKAPQSYIGVIGPVQIETALDGSRASTDDALSYKLRLRHRSDKLLVEPPVVDLGPDVEVYAPELIQNDQNQVKGGLEFVKTWNYNLIFKEPGKYQISPDIITFQPDSNVFVRYPIDTQIVEIIAGANYVANDRSEVQVEQPKIELSATTTLRKSRAPIMGSTMYWLLICIPILWVVYHEYQNYRTRKNKLIKVEKTPFEKAQDAINRVRETDDSKEYFNGIRVALEHYMAELLNIPFTALSKQEVHKQWKESGFSSAHLESYHKVISACELAVYAGRQAASDNGKLADEAEKVLQSIESLQSKP